MNDQLKPIETLLREQKYAEAEEALKARMAENPDDWDAKLLYGICRKLQGDEGAFREIHEEAEKATGDEKKSIEASPLWKKYHRSYTGCLVAALIVGAGLVAGVYIENETGIIGKGIDMVVENWKKAEKAVVPDYTAPTCLYSVITKPYHWEHEPNPNGDCLHFELDERN